MADAMLNDVCMAGAMLNDVCMADAMLNDVCMAGAMFPADFVLMQKCEYYLLMSL